jgi:hypothetical protein
MCFAGAPDQRRQANAIRTYLIASFPEKAAEAGRIDRPARSSCERATPTRAPHDPLARLDGMLWWSASSPTTSAASIPKTGEAKEYPIPVKGGHTG